jgi:flavin reductase (DIM6/NTAB) family NADH-FMN oxidoreductase RutF
MAYENLSLGKAFLEIEEGPMVLLTASFGKEDDICAISWLMPLGFSDKDCNIAVMSGPWNHTVDIALASKECCINVPTVSLMQKAITAGTYSGAGRDKFKELGFRKEKGAKIKTPHILGCAAYIECVITEYIEDNSILILHPVKAGIDPVEHKNPKFHARGDGHFYVDGEEKNFSDLMKEKIPSSVD